jgi:tetrahydromethanopterin S-methyltransferase subunit C
MALRKFLNLKAFAIGFGVLAGMVAIMMRLFNLPFWIAALIGAGSMAVIGALAAFEE